MKRLLILVLFPFLMGVGTLAVWAYCEHRVTCPFHGEPCEWLGKVRYDDTGVEYCTYSCRWCPVEHEIDAPGV